jgi:hypothetical protein
VNAHGTSGATTGDIRGGRAFLGIVTFMGSRHFIANIAAGVLKGLTGFYPLRV